MERRYTTPRNLRWRIGKVEGVSHTEADKRALIAAQEKRLRRRARNYGIQLTAFAASVECDFEAVKIVLEGRGTDPDRIGFDL